MKKIKNFAALLTLIMVILNMKYVINICPNSDITVYDNNIKQPDVKG